MNWRRDNQFVGRSQYAPILRIGVIGLANDILRFSAICVVGHQRTQVRTGNWPDPVGRVEGFPSDGLPDVDHPGCRQVSALPGVQEPVHAVGSHLPQPVFHGQTKPHPGAVCIHPVIPRFAQCGHADRGLDGPRLTFSQLEDFRRDRALLQARMDGVIRTLLHFHAAVPRDPQPVGAEPQRRLRSRFRVEHLSWLQDRVLYGGLGFAMRPGDRDIARDVIDYRSLCRECGREQQREQLREQVKYSHRRFYDSPAAPWRNLHAA